MNTHQFNCPLCGTTDYQTIKTFSDKVVVGKCKECELTYTPKRHNTPDDLFEDISTEKLYMMYRPILENKKKHFRYKIFNQYLAKVAPFVTGKKHLDVGCAHGFFIDISHKKGFEVTGVEPNKVMAEFGKKHLNLKIHNGTLDRINLTEKWDLITFTDSLEYFMNPIEDLNPLVKNNLNEDGVIFIKVPNGDYFYTRHFLKQRFGIGIGGAEAYSPSKRVAHYNNKTIKNLAEKLNLEVLQLGYFLPIDSPIWYKYVGIHLEIANPWWMGVKERFFRKLLHMIGLMEFLLIRKNHFSQAVYIIARKI